MLVSDVFGQGTPDVDWIPRAREFGCAIVTRDIATRSNPAEREALMQCDCHVFIVRGGGLKLNELQALMKQHHTVMVRYVLKYATPFIAHVTSKSINVHEESGRWADQRKG